MIQYLERATSSSPVVPQLKYEQLPFRSTPYGATGGFWSRMHIQRYNALAGQKERKEDDVNEGITWLMIAFQVNHFFSPLNM